MKFTNFLKEILDQFGGNIQLGLPAEIDSFNKTAMRADVKFFLQSEQNDIKKSLIDYPIIPNIPVQFIFAGGFYIRPEYVRGDKVWVTFSTYDIQDALDEYTRAESKSIFNMNNAVVSQSIATNKFVVPAEFQNESGLLIGHKNGSSYIVFSSNSIIAKFGTGKTIQLDANGLKVNGFAKQYVTHTELNTALQAMVTLANSLFLTGATGAVKSGGLTLDISAAKSTQVQSI
jgi:hypothetical protein